MFSGLFGELWSVWYGPWTSDFENLRKEKEPEYRGVPSVVAQYHKSRDALYEGQFDDKMKNLQRGGEGIIAVSYEARARGIKRGETRYLRLVLKLSDWPICILKSDWSKG